MGAWTTYKVNLRNTEATIETAQRQHEVELAKIQAENDRLREEAREEERRNRKNTYHEFLDALTQVYQVLGSTVSRERRNPIFHEYNHLLSGVILFGRRDVRETATDLQVLNRKAWTALNDQRETNPDKADPDCWRDATIGLRDEFSTLFTRLTDLMHADVTQGILD